MHPETKKVQKVQKINKTRTQIIEVANHLFQKFGFEKTSMEDIAAAAHKAKRSLYNHFTDKEALFSSVAVQELDNIYQQLRQIFEDTTVQPLERLQHFLLSRFDLIADSGIYHLVLENMAVSPASLRFDVLKQHVREFESWEHSALVALWHERAGEEKNQETARNAEAFADMAQMLFKSLDYSFFVQNKYKNYKETYSYLVNLIINSLNK